jgi:hypothetical protein
MLDYRKNDIGVGATVAFNRSGEVRIGTVMAVEVSRTKMRWDRGARKFVPSATIKVKDLKDSKISSVTNRFNLSVITPEDGRTSASRWNDEN